MPLRFFTPQQMLINAPLASVFAAMTRFGGGPGKPGENYSEILEQDGSTYIIRFTTYVGKNKIVTKEEVNHYAPNIVTYYHLESPLAYVYEVFTALPLSSTQVLLNYMGEYRMKRYDYPVIGWLIHRFLVLPRYDAVIAKHIAKVRTLAEGSRAAPASAAS